jgi:hypothetical protein
MKRTEKTVFISYRRRDESWALAVFGDLTHNGYDVFVDYDGIASGNFETAILENIKARAHFLVLLTPTALERSAEPSDWMRLEIEAALDSGRNIVPLMLDGFNFSAPSIRSQLVGKLEGLSQINGLPVPEGYFTEAMERLRNRFLNIQVDTELHPASDAAQQVAKEQKDKAMAAELHKAAEIEQRTGERAPGTTTPRLQFRTVFASVVAALIGAAAGSYFFSGHKLNLSVEPNDLETSALPPARILINGEVQPQPVKYDVVRDTVAVVDISKAIDKAKESIARYQAERDKSETEQGVIQKSIAVIGGQIQELTDLSNQVNGDICGGGAHGVPSPVRGRLSSQASSISGTLNSVVTGLNETLRH